MISVDWEQGELRPSNSFVDHFSQRDNLSCFLYHWFLEADILNYLQPAISNNSLRNN